MLFNTRRHPRQPDDELGELVDSTFDRDRSAVLLGHDIVTDRESKAGTFAGRLCGEERRKDLCKHVRWNTYTVVADAHFDLVSEVMRGHPQDRMIIRAGLAILPAILRSIKAISEQVEKHTRDVLGNQLDGTKIGVEVALDRNVEFPILCASAMIGEVERLFDQRVDIDVLALAAPAPGMQEHAFDDAVGTTAVLGNLGQIVIQRPNQSLGLGVFLCLYARYRRAERLPQLAQKRRRDVSEIIHKVQWVLDLVSNSRGQLAKRRHFLGMDQICLGRLQLAIGLLNGSTGFGGGIAGRLQFSFALL